MRRASVTAGEHRPVGLHQGENVGRANAKQQHTSTASSVPIIRQCPCSVSPEAPLVVIESTE